MDKHISGHDGHHHRHEHSVDASSLGIREVAKKQGVSHSTIEWETTECHCTDTKLLEAD